MKQKTGYLIALEGGEGGGKTTQVTRLVARLQAKGLDAVSLREPGGTEISEQIRSVVLSTKNKGMSYTTEVLLFQAARAQIYEELVIPALEAGKIVVMDRTRDSSIVYQGMVRGFGVELIDQLNEISTKKTYPDLTVLLDLPVKIGLKRREESGKVDRLDMEIADFHERVRHGYLQWSRRYPKRWVTIDATQTVEEVEQAIWQAVETRLQLSNGKNGSKFSGSVSCDE